MSSTITDQWWRIAAAGLGGMAPAALGGVAILGLLAAGQDSLAWLLPVAAGCALGALAGLIAGWQQAERVLAPASPGWRLLLGTAAVSVLGAATVTALGFGLWLGTDARLEPGAASGLGLLTGAATALAGVLAWGAIAMLYGLLLFGLPALVFATVSVALWARAARRLIGVRQPSPTPDRAAGPRGAGRLGRRHAAVLCLGIAAAIVGTVARAMANDPPGIHDGALVGWLGVFLAPSAVWVTGIRRDTPLLVASGAIGMLAGALAAGLPAGLVAAAASVGMLATAGRSWRVPTRTAFAGVGIVTLLLVAGPVAFAATAERVCWDTYADLGRVMRISSEQPNGPSEVPVLESACLERADTPLGAIVATIAAGAAVTFAWTLARNRKG